MIWLATFINEGIIGVGLIAVILILAKGYTIAKSDMRDGWMGFLGGVGLLVAVVTAGATVGVPALGIQGLSVIGIEGATVATSAWYLP